MAFFHLKGNVLEYVVFLLVGKPNQVQFDIPLHFFWAEAAFIGDVLAGGKEFEDSGGTHYTHLEGIESVCNHPNGSEKELQVHDKGDQNTDLQIHPEHAYRSVPDYQANSNGLYDLSNREINGIVEDRTDVGSTVLAVDFFEFLVFSFFPIKKLHDGHPSNVFLQEGIQVGHGIAHVVEGDFDFFLKYVGGDHQKR